MASLSPSLPLAADSMSQTTQTLPPPQDPPLWARVYNRFRIIQYRLLSDCSQVSGRPQVWQPVQMTGRGSIKFEGEVKLGHLPSPFFYSGHIYLEARKPGAVIQLGDGVFINNGSCFISEGPGIFVGKGTMFGWQCEVIDSDFHDLHSSVERAPSVGKVMIGENVVVGSNVKILKGVRIGNNSVVANGSVVTRSFPANCLVFGNPAKGLLRRVPTVQ